MPNPGDPHASESKTTGQDTSPATPPGVAPPEVIPPPEVPEVPFGFGGQPTMPSATKGSKGADAEEPEPDEPEADKTGTAQPRPEAKKEPYRSFEGTWVIRFAETGKGRRYVIEANGDVAWGLRSGHLTKLGANTLIEFNDGTLDRIKLVRNRTATGLEIERFASKASYPATVAQHGKGRRVHKRAG